MRKILSASDFLQLFASFVASEARQTSEVIILWDHYKLLKKQVLVEGGLNTWDNKNQLGLKKISSSLNKIHNRIDKQIEALSKEIGDLKTQASKKKALDQYLNKKDLDKRSDLDIKLKLELRSNLITDREFFSELIILADRMKTELVVFTANRIKKPRNKPVKLKDMLSEEAKKIYPWLVKKYHGSSPKIAHLMYVILERNNLLNQTLPGYDLQTKAIAEALKLPKLRRQSLFNSKHKFDSPDIKTQDLVRSHQTGIVEQLHKAQ